MVLPSNIHAVLVQQEQPGLDRADFRGELAGAKVATSGASEEILRIRAIDIRFRNDTAS
jgi:hypothetical protein